jgi:hypothetical protein
MPLKTQRRTWTMPNESTIEKPTLDPRLVLILKNMVGINTASKNVCQSLFETCKPR